MQLQLKLSAWSINPSDRLKQQEVGAVRPWDFARVVLSLSLSEKNIRESVAVAKIPGISGIFVCIKTQVDSVPWFINGRAGICCFVKRKSTVFFIGSSINGRTGRSGICWNRVELPGPMFFFSLPLGWPFGKTLNIGSTEKTRRNDFYCKIVLEDPLKSLTFSNRHKVLPKLFHKKVFKFLDFHGFPVISSPACVNTPKKCSSFRSPCRFNVEFLESILCHQ